MRCWRVAVALAFGLGLWLGSFEARADGKAFAKAGFARATIPEQRALVHWNDGWETLVIETVVRAEGTNFAWVVPLPAIPEEVAPVAPAVFPTLQNIFQARVESRVDGSGEFLAGCAVLLWLVRAVVGFKGSREERLASALALLAAIVLGTMFLLPALAKAKGGGADAVRSTVSVLDRQRAGVFEVTTLTARAPADLLDWLRTHGFDAPAELEPVVAEHLRDGWVFVAARAMRDRSGAEPFALHPLKFRFRAPEPVYPLRLTGVGSGPVRVDLFVFGPGRASADGFREEYCGNAKFEPFLGVREAPSGLHIRQADLKQLVGSAEVGTKLSARLDPESLRRDAILRWHAFRPHGQVMLTPRAARAQAFLWTGGLLFAGAVWGLGRQIFGRRRRPMFRRGHFLFGGAAMLVGVVAYVAMPRVADDGMIRVRRGVWRNAMIGLEVAGLDALEEAGRTPATEGRRLEVEAARALVGEAVREHLKETNFPPDILNVFTGRPMIEEASPGNYSLDVSNRTVVFRWHDWDGAPVTVGDVPIDPEPPSPTSPGRPGPPSGRR